jgi:hypothetical protein
MKMLNIRSFRVAGTNPVFRTALFAAAATAALSASGMQAASADECKSVVGRCAMQVGGWCEPKPGGGQTAYFYEKNGHSAAFEACISREAKARGLRDPYAPASAAAAGPSTKPAAKLKKR